MDQLIAFRALQGLGAGGLMVGVIATIGDMVAPRERGQYMGYIMAAMMLAMVAGPLVGGYITDDWSWRWIFYINMPVGGAALIYLFATLRLPYKRVQHKIDYFGAGTLAVVSTAIVLLTTWGGTEYGWGSPEIVGLGAVAVVALVAFLFVQTRASEPVLPLPVFRNRNFSVASGMSFLTGFAMLGALTFLPLYQQTVQGLSAVGSGLMLIPMMVGVTATSLASGIVMTRTGRYKAFPVIGGAVMTLAMFLLTHLGLGTSKVTTGLFFLVLGLGMGFLMQITSVIVQNSVEPRDIGVASSARTYFQQIGGSIGVALFGAVFTRRLTETLGSGSHLSVSGGQLNPVTVSHLQEPFKHDVLYAISHSIDGVFWLALPLGLLLFALAWFIKEVPLRSSAPPPAAETPASEPEFAA